MAGLSGITQLCEMDQATNGVMETGVSSERWRGIGLTGRG